MNNLRTMFVRTFRCPAPGLSSPRFLNLRSRFNPYSTSTPLVSRRSIPAPNCGSISILSLNRPSSRNAISVQLLAELRAHIDSIAAEPADGPTRALILSSAHDTVFCAGADLKERATFSPQQTTDFLTALRATFHAIAHLPIPTIAALHGTAFGGGLELALTTTLRVFASTANVGLPETRLAILPGAGGTYRLPALIGLTRARDLILTGRRVAGPEAYFLGLCDRLVEVPEPANADDGRVMVLEGAVELARTICEGAPVAVRRALGAVNGWEGGEKVENEAYEGVLGTEDRVEALRAFAEKRKPAFKGR